MGDSQETSPRSNLLLVKRRPVRYKAYIGKEAQIKALSAYSYVGDSSKLGRKWVQHTLGTVNHLPEVS